MFDINIDSYSIDVRDWNDCKEVIDSGLIDCSYLKMGDLDYDYPANLYVENGAIKEWHQHEIRDFTVNEWLNILNNN